MKIQFLLRLLRENVAKHAANSKTALFHLSTSPSQASPQRLRRQGSTSHEKKVVIPDGITTSSRQSLTISQFLSRRLAKKPQAKSS